MKRRPSPPAGCLTPPATPPSTHLLDSAPALSCSSALGPGRLSPAHSALQGHRPRQPMSPVPGPEDLKGRGNASGPSPLSASWAPGPLPSCALWDPRPLLDRSTKLSELLQPEHRLTSHRGSRPTLGFWGGKRWLCLSILPACCSTPVLVRRADPWVRARCPAGAKCLHVLLDLSLSITPLGGCLHGLCSAGEGKQKRKRARASPSGGAGGPVL